MRECHFSKAKAQIGAPFARFSKSERPADNKRNIAFPVERKRRQLICKSDRVQPLTLDTCLLYTSIKAPLSHISFLAVGGVDLSNIADFMKAGVCGVGLGGNIVKKDLIQNKQFDKITELAKKYVAAVAD